MNFTEIKNDLFKKYNITPAKIKSGEKDKESLLYYLLTAFEYAKNNYNKGSLTSFSFCAAVVLEDNSVHFGLNFNNTRCEISSICAERMAILDAFNSKVKNFKEGQKFDYKIKYILMSVYKGEEAFWTDKMTPCADCLSWFNTGCNLSSETKICYLRKENEEIFLEAQKLDDFLPLRNLKYEVFENTPVLKYKSENAKKSNLKENEIIKLYKKVLSVYKNNQMAQTSGQNIAAGIISNGEIFTGQKIDFSKRWFIEPLEAASIKAIEKYGQNTKIEAVCYVGEEFTTTETGAKVKDGLISLKTLGRLNTKFSNPNTLVITGFKDGIQIYTIGDYMPNKHKFIHDYKIN